MPELKNDRLIRALLKQPVDKTPVWIMRQAGRYLPEYQATRRKAGDFLTLCKTPELACEVTMQPLERFALDAAILFSDILTIPDAMGLGLYFSEGEGPKFERPVRTIRDINSLTIPCPETELGYVTAAIRTIQQALNRDVPLLGFSGSPWTLATYMVEGGPSKNFHHIKRLLFTEPAHAHQLLTTISRSVTDYLNAQIAAGVDAVMIFDTWGGILSHQDYLGFSLSYMQQILSGLQTNYNGRKIPVVFFTKNGGLWLEDIARAGCDAIGLDWTIRLGDARRRVGDLVSLQGNMDPAKLLGTPQSIRQEVAQILEDYGHGSGHVFNLGHGITPDVAPENVAYLIDAVHELSQPYHSVQ